MGSPESGGRHGRGSLSRPLLVGMLVVCLAVPCRQTAQAADAGYEVPWVRIIPEKPADLESWEGLLEIYSYYAGYKKNTGDYAALGALIRVDIGEGWELRAFGDVLSWQEPSMVGLGDVAAGVKWNFLKGVFSAAAALDVEFPSGGREFREPGPEPTLSFLVSRKFGSFEPSCVVSSTYVSGGNGENDYFSTLLSLGLDYTLNETHALSLYATGYTPAGSSDHSSRLSAGISYTYTQDACNAYSITFTKGFSARGMAWSIGLSYDYAFNLQSLVRNRHPLSD